MLHGQRLQKRNPSLYLYLHIPCRDIDIWNSHDLLPSDLVAQSVEHRWSNPKRNPSLHHSGGRRIRTLAGPTLRVRLCNYMTLSLNLIWGWRLWGRPKWTDGGRHTEAPWRAGFASVHWKTGFKISHYLMSLADAKQSHWTLTRCCDRNPQKNCKPPCVVSVSYIKALSLSLFSLTDFSCKPWDILLPFLVENDYWKVSVLEWLSKTNDTWKLQLLKRREQRMQT